MPPRNQSPSPHPPRSRAAGALLSAILWGAACTTTTRPAAPAPLPPVQPVPGVIVDRAVRFDLRPLGSIPSDGVTMPVLSPDGRYLAVQTGVAPDIRAALARPGARPPLASRIALYRVDPRGIVRLGETDGGLVLGRSADRRGFLIESVRPDGARWIGRVDWSTREIEWLVQDGNVNAFAVLGDDGTLAYATRGLTERNFDLVVRRDGRAARLAGDGTRSYLFPTLSEDGTRVYALALRDGILEFLAADPSSTESMTQSASRALVTDRGSDELALHMVSAQGARGASEGGDWIVFHRELASLIRWNERDGIRPFEGGVLAQARVDADREAVLIDGRLRVRPRQSGTAGTQGEPGTQVLDRLGVPRALGSVEDRPAIAVFVPEAGGLRVVVIRMLEAAD